MHFHFAVLTSKPLKINCPLAFNICSDYGFHFSRILIFREKRIFAKNEKKTKNRFSQFLPNFCHFCGFFNQWYWKFQFLAGNNFKDFIFCHFSKWIVLKTMQNFKKSSKMAKIWQKFSKKWRKSIFRFSPSIFREKTKNKLRKTKIFVFRWTP